MCRGVARISGDAPALHRPCSSMATVLCMLERQCTQNAPRGGGGIPWNQWMPGVVERVDWGGPAVHQIK